MFIFFIESMKTMHAGDMKKENKPKMPAVYCSICAPFNSKPKNINFLFGFFSTILMIECLRQDTSERETGSFLALPLSFLSSSFVSASIFIGRHREGEEQSRSGINTEREI